jgi:23S rRNA (cytosine1962-C5)-methyltransferase
MNRVILKPGRDKTARQHHPWVFSGAIERADRNIKPGEIVEVLDHGGNFVAFGYYNKNSQIGLRLLEWNHDVNLDDAWWFDKLKASIYRRSSLARDNKTDSYRLIYGESDLLPGLIVDKYADYLVMQVSTFGIENIKISLVSALTTMLFPLGIYERSDSESRILEGLQPSSGILAGQEPPDQVVIKENGFSFIIDIKTGQKSGTYLDQRENRLAVSRFAGGLDVLDCFAYTGGFSVNLLGHDAKSVTLIDTSKQSLDIAIENIKLNGFDTASATTICGDVFKVLRGYRNEQRKFDMIILDPPKFAPSKADLKKALTGYKDINLLAMNLLKPGGILATFSCSGAVDSQTLQTVLFWASTDSNRDVQIIQTMSQSIDHPRLATFPESEYLKGFICRVI